MTQLDSAGVPACTAACVIDQGLDLGVDQPDLTPATDALTFLGAAPDLGAIETAPCAEPDAGVEDVDAGARTAQRLSVGCGCGPGESGWLLAGLLVFTRRRTSA